MMEILFAQIDINQTANTFKDVVSVLGISTTFCGILGFVVYKMGTFFADKIYSPLQESHMGLVKKLEASLDEQQKINIQMLNTLSALTDKLSSLSDSMEKLEEKCEAISKITILKDM